MVLKKSSLHTVIRFYTILNHIRSEQCSLIPEGIFHLVTLLQVAFLQKLVQLKARVVPVVPLVLLHTRDLIHYPGIHSVRLWGALVHQSFDRNRPLIHS